MAASLEVERITIRNPPNPVDPYFKIVVFDVAVRISIHLNNDEQKFLKFSMALVHQSDYPQLTIIQQNRAVSSQDKCRQVLELWARRGGSRWEDVIAQLRGIELSKLADELTEELHRSSQPPPAPMTVNGSNTPGELLGLPQSSESIECAFSSFVDDLFDILEQVNFSEVKRRVLQNVNVVGGMSLSKDTIYEIHIAENYETLCLHCRQYWNWMNIRMLEKMAGSSLAAKQRIEKYKKNIYSRKIKNVISEFYDPEILPSSYTKVKEFWGKDYDDLTIKDVVKRWSEIEKKFNVEETTLLRSIGIEVGHDDQSESYEIMLTKLEMAKANKETVKVSYTTIMFCGSSGVGKTNLIKKLNKEDLNAHHNSSGVAESKHTVSIETAAVTKSAEGLRWTNFNHDSMISQLNKLLLNLRFSSLSSAIESAQSDPVSSPQDSIPSTSSEKTTNKENEDDSAEADSVAVDIATADSSNTPSLGEVWKVINFLDTGGQPEFVNVLPAVSNSIGLTFIVFNLSESLDDLVLVKHNVDGAPSFKPYPLDCTNLDFIKRLIVSSENFNKIVTSFKGVQMKDGEDYHSKICYLGTHALKKGVSGENIKETDNRLSSIIDEFKLQKRTFWSSPKPELTSLFPIDLFPPDEHKESFDNIIQNIRDNIHDQVQGQGYYEVPITWFIFLLKLQKLCNIKKISFVSYQDAVDVWMGKHISSEFELRAEPSQGLLYKDQDKSIDRKNSDVHNVLLFFHFMGMLFYYDKVQGIRDFVFIDRQWLFNKLTELVKVKFTKGCNNISTNDVNKFKKEGRLNSKIIKNLMINLQDIQALHFINLLDYLNIVAPIDAEEYFMPCVLESFPAEKFSELEFYGCIQRVPLLVRFKNGPLPHGFFCHLIVALFKKLPKGWNLPHQAGEMKHVYNNLITFPTFSGYSVTLFYKIEHLEIQVRSKRPQPPVIHSNVRHKLDIVLKKAADNLELTNEQLCYGFYCECADKHFAAIPEDFSECACIFCNYKSVDIKEDHRAWFQDIEDDKLQQGSSVTETVICANVKTKVMSNYEGLMKIRADAILPGLFAKEVITSEEKEIIDAKQLNREKMGYLIDTVIIKSLDVGIITKYKEFLKVLERNEDLAIKTIAQRLGHSKDLP